MIKFKDFQLGYADADTELIRKPELFDNAFYDPNNYIDELVNGYSFLVMGRKGVGKTALGAKIKRLAEQNFQLKSESLHLSDFQFNTFNKATSSKLQGGLRYVNAWEFLLLLKVIQTIKKKFVEGLENIEFNEIAASLENYGLLPNKGLSKTVRLISKKNFHITLPTRYGDVGYEDDNCKETELAEIEEISEIIMEVLEKLYLGSNKIIIIIDGLDDVLRAKDKQLQIISGLVRAINNLNSSFVRIELPIKLILMARTDIISLCNDPDLNKIKRDSGILINWHYDVKNQYNSDLMKLIQLRFHISGVSEDKLSDIWDRLFPSLIDNKQSWNFVMEHTLNRPRDILQFLIECKKLYPNKTSLKVTELKSVLSSYSENYFLEEMKNELAGFVEDSILKDLPNFLSRLESRTFRYSKWVTEFKNVFKSDNPKNLLEIMFDNGYIGQLRARGKRTFVVFRYRDNHEKINYRDQFIIHRGLFKALNLS